MLHALLISIVESAFALGLVAFAVTALHFSAEARFQLWATVLLVALTGFSASFIASRRPVPATAASANWIDERMGIVVDPGTNRTVQLASSTRVTHEIVELASDRTVLWTWAGRIWLFGVFLCASQIFSSLLQTVHLRREAKSARKVEVDPSVSEVLSDFPRTVRVIELASARTPIFLGFGRPLIVLPKRASKAFSADDLRFIVAHELEHCRRRDDYIDLASRVLTALFWPNPSVHLARHFMVIERECACDEAGSRVLRSDVGAAHSLWRTAQTLGLAPTNAIGALGTSSQLVRRIRRLTARRPQRELNSKIVISAITPLLVIAIFVATIASPGTARSPDVVNNHNPFGALEDGATTMNDSHWAARKLENGEVARREKRFREARADFAAAAAWYAAHGPIQMQVRALSRQAQIERDLGNYDAAIGFQESALQLQRKMGPEGLAHVVRHLADILDDAGRHHEASPYYVEMEMLYRKSSGTPPLEMANAIRSLAVHAEHVGDKKRAQQLWAETRDRYSKLDQLFVRLTGEQRNPGVEEATRRLASL